MKNTLTEITEQDKKETLKNFIEEFIPFKELKKIGFFDKSVKSTDYQKIADRVCQFFGYETIYEYGTKEFNCHLTFTDEKHRKGEQFVTQFKNYLED